MSYNPDEDFYQDLQKQVKGIDDKKNDDASCCKHAEQLEQQLKQCQSQGRPFPRGSLTYKPRNDEWLEKNFMRKKKNNGSLTDFGGGKRSGANKRRKRTNKRKRTKRTKRTNKKKRRRTKRKRTNKRTNKK